MSLLQNDRAFLPGETVEFVVTNTGQFPHEFVIDSIAGNTAHGQTMMKAMANGGKMEYDDPNTMSVAPGETGELTWTITEPGTFEAACNIPGHYQAGLNAQIDVS